MSWRSRALRMIGNRLEAARFGWNPVLGPPDHRDPITAPRRSRASTVACQRDRQGRPAAEAIRNNELPREAIDWSATNYYKTALELEHCLRLPEEGPCQCDLYLTCPKFITTTKYAPRLRDRLCLERQLATNAAEQGWPREVERHTAIARRITDLLQQLGEPPDDRPKGEV